MKATKIILPNGKERILIEVKPSEYSIMQDILWADFMKAPDDADKKEDKRYTAFSNAVGGAAESFNDFVNHKDDQAV